LVLVAGGDRLTRVSSWSDTTVVGVRLRITSSATWSASRSKASPAADLELGLHDGAGGEAVGRSVADRPLQREHAGRGVDRRCGA
jgi:hypothetical protein